MNPLVAGTSGEKGVQKIGSGFLAVLDGGIENLVKTQDKVVFVTNE